MSEPLPFWRLALLPDVRRRALGVALVVGTILGVINHVDVVLDGTFTTKNLVQVLVTYLVPYSVSTYSSVRTLRVRNTQ